MSLIENINKDLQKAMKEKNALRLDTLRMMKSKVLYVNAKGDLPDEEILKILNKYAKSLEEAIEWAKKVGRLDVSEKTLLELKIVEEYLPKKLSEKELKEIVKKVIAESGASSMKDMGRVMKEIMGKHPAIDGKLLKDLVEQTLQR
ncbi:MAG: GatB/YqeY domain-containing protein [Candidatus Saganbacteria bacterium]|nr:GatB/YqeY domain-containing protein [Candidatus Saganbacteria bacterium]